MKLNKIRSLKSVRLIDFLSDSITLLVISFALTFLVVMPAINPRNADLEIGTAVSKYVSHLLPPGTYHGVDRYGDRCQVESSINHSLRIRSGGYDFSFEQHDLSFAEDLQSSNLDLHFTLRNGGLKWCGQNPSLPCWQQVTMHKTVWLGHGDQSGAPYVTVLDRFADKAECYGLRKLL